MALERLSLAPVVVESNGGEDMNKAPRLPRWTRQELLVLIQGKRVAENRVRRGRAAVLSSQVEPKWSSVSSYCKRHGVNRGPVQCRKRWSNLAGDFKKIKEWESQMKEKQEEAAESFWVMRNDLRRERKLPGFFDREVYDILDGGGGTDKSLVLSLAPSHDDTDKDKEVVFDSGRTDDALFSDEVLASPDKDTPTPISATQYEPFSPAPATTQEQDKESIPNPEEIHEEGIGLGRKRKREVEVEVEMSLIEAMERNGRLLTSQLEIQNANSQLDREQRKEHANNLFSVLNKLADAMVRIADKL